MKVRQQPRGDLDHLVTATNSLAGRSALVTAGGSGIGRAVAKRLAQDGALVIVTDIDENTARATVGEIRHAGGVADARRLDARDASAIEALGEEVQGLVPHLHVLVNGVGGSGSGRPRRALECNTGSFDEIFTLNLKSTFLVCKAMLPLMSGGASIVNISSNAAHHHLTGSALYGRRRQPWSVSRQQSLSTTLATESGPTPSRPALLPVLRSTA